uniref:Tc1-like transposase DDE domain-containing protein n=2 Tax=Nothobranchius furzeri TaxID=105023 RepID=A0A1A8B4L4_NOTFU
MYTGGHHGGSRCCPKKNIVAWQVCKRTPGCSTGSWPDEIKVELFGRTTQHYVWRRTGTAQQHQNLIPTVMHGGEGIMVWGCFAASGPELIVDIEGKMTSQMYQDILQDNLWPSVYQLKLSRRWLMQQDNNPTHRSKSTTENAPYGVSQSES